MAQRYVRLKTVKSFDDWIEERRRNMEQLARAAGNNKPLTKMDAMRIISKDKEGVRLSPQLRFLLLKKKNRI